MMKKWISFGLILGVLNTAVYRPAFAFFADSSAQSSAQSSSQSSVESSSQSSSDSSSKSSEPSVSVTVTLLVLVVLAATGLIIWGISTTTGSGGEKKPNPQVEVSILVDEAARINGHNLDVLSRVYALDKTVIAGIIMQGYLDQKISAATPESAGESIVFLSESLLSKSVELNGTQPAVIEKLKNDPAKLQAIMSAMEENKSPSEIMSMVFAF
jgi:hypothetical protein